MLYSFHFINFFAAVMAALIPFMSPLHLVHAEDSALEMNLPENVNASEPVRIFVQAGQSGCTGQASARLLVQDNETYPDLVGSMDRVYLAGLYNVDEFLIRQMLAGEASEKNNFGPEVSIGRRIADASTGSSPIMIVKYCSGGSNLEKQWNPEAPGNSWDRNADDGSAAWMLENELINFQEKNSLYANLIYIIRKTVETLENASIPYEFSGFFWIQGQGDVKRTWQQYGDNLISLFETARIDLNEPYLPVVDFGAEPHHNLQTGKVYAASAISNGNVTTAAFGLASANPESCCIPSPSNACIDSTFVNFSVFEHYGYDPVFYKEPYNEMKPENSTDEEFFWFKEFPSNQHAEYEGMILRGNLLANQYLRAFSPMWANLTSDLEVDDAMVLFPWNECSDEEGLSSDNVCWINLQNIAITPPECPNNNMCGVRCLFNRVIGFVKRVFRFLISLMNF